MERNYCFEAEASAPGEDRTEVFRGEVCVWIMASSLSAKAFGGSGGSVQKEKVGRGFPRYVNL